MFRDQMYQCPVQTLTLPLPLPLEREWKSNAEIAPNCPRCASPNTKFCYYNNYSSSQPRYFCKGCRRYWTKGGSLRNVPVGGGSCRRRRRKNRRARSSRLPHDRGVSDNSSKNFSGFSSDSKVPDIDLAVVFAKFLNDDRQELGTTATAETDSVIDGARSSTRMDSDAMIGCQQKLFDNNLLEEDDDDRIRDLLGLETWLSDGAVDDVSLLSDSPAAGLPDFTWQPMLQFQEDLDCFPTELDQLKTSASLINDHWTCFDLSGFEIY